ncbi:MAG: hypothetical protein JXB47_10215 [Anaerolineae bacterium]|nr:hypothetical protein [Anaerolineae bacterium]
MNTRHAVTALLIAFITVGLLGCQPASTPTPTLEPTEEATVEPTEEVTEEATETVTEAATEEATEEATEAATEAATEEASESAAPAAAQPLPDDFEQGGLEAWQGDLWQLSIDEPGYGGSAGALKGFCDDICRANQAPLSHAISEIPEDALGIGFAWKMDLDLAANAVLTVGDQSYLARVRAGDEEWTRSALKWEDFLYGSREPFDPSLAVDTLEFRVGQGMLGQATLWLDDVRFITDPAEFE